MPRGLLNVFITIDTEITAPYSDRWRETGLSFELARDIHGRTRSGDFGIGHQMRVMNEHGLEGVFFVEALCADAAGDAPLAEIVATVQEHGHEVQLHLHTEWLRRLAEPLPGVARTGQNIRDFPLEEQVALLRRGAENLRRAGAPAPVAYRAGNYGADEDTLRALARTGIRYDTSYNFTYADAACGLGTLGTLRQPRSAHGLLEFPITYFRDRPGHWRHAQLCACSAGELEWVLLEAWRRGWWSVVIVSHSFELIRRPGAADEIAAPNRVVVGRFERLCRFLASHRDKFRTRGFAGLDPDEVPTDVEADPLESSLGRTSWRLVEQLLSRVY